MSDNIYDALRESHEVQRSLLRSLVRIRDAQRRQEVFTELRIELAAHEAAEERALYVPMLMDDAGLDASRHALHEHHQIDELVADLQSLAINGKAWEKKAAELSEKVHHHLREEEKKFFQVSGKILSETQKVREAKRYRREHLRMARKLAQA
jgi:hypothetical protein